MYTSFITTVYNEENSINEFLESLVAQTTHPDEVIIVDAKSTDATPQIIKEFIKKNNLQSWKLFEQPGNRAQGRNLAISHAQGRVILCSDVGCILEKHWVSHITQPFQDMTVDVVAGYYTPIYNTVFEQCLATYTSVMKDRVDVNNFLPSSRSVAFKKKSWKDIGGYPEWLDYCEDLYFASRLKQTNKKFVTRLDAVVMWPQQNTIAKAMRQFFYYAVGDGQAHYIRPQTPLLFARYSLALILLTVFFYSRNTLLLMTILVAFIGYITWAIYKNYQYVKKIQAFFWLPVLQFVADFAVMSGMIVGVLTRKEKI